MPTIGVLALQGDFEAHEKAFQQAGARTVQVRAAADLDSIDALVIPGGESTTMLKLIHAESLMEPLRQFGLSKPIFGTCAGAILLASQVSQPEQDSLGLIDISIQRNAYGRQLQSHVAQLDLDGKPLEAVFIRAPIIRRTGGSVRVLARHKGDPVLVEQGPHLAATFHPELTAGRGVQILFLEKVRTCAKN
ncbi:MAG: pyridoxal 5'-phosphate synthase glutaminase subunit PdxT [Acidimicrobiia bacterium]|nr:pyridoxal 5'-phosphate synthase glutaminase subunit PdxT [Acidimicrobiia bacterium]